MNVVTIPVNYKELKTDIWAVSFQLPTVVRTPIAIKLLHYSGWTNNRKIER